jgi:hypothetical protein
MPVYDLDKLMEQTRRLAAEYRAATGQTLPVSAELAVHDACKLLSMSPVTQPEAGVDATLGDKRFQIKSRVLFQPEKKGYRVGQLNPKGAWDGVLLVLYDSEYQPMEIWSASREELSDALDKKTTNPRGSLTVEKFKALGRLAWQRNDT